MIELTSHVIERMAERGISGKEIRAVLNNFERKAPYGNGFRLFGTVNGRKLVVGVASDGVKIIVTTAFERN